MPDEIKTTGTDATPLEGQDSSKRDESNSQQPKLRTEAEYQKGIADAIAVYGDKIKREKLDVITQERDTYKSQVADLQTKTEALAEIQSELDELKVDYKTATDGNADLEELQEIKTKLRATEKQLKADYKAKQDAADAVKKTMDAEREQFAGDVAEAQAMKFEVDLFEVAEEYADGDSARLKSLCELYGKKTRDEIKKTANILWQKLHA